MRRFSIIRLLAGGSLSGSQSAMKFDFQRVFACVAIGAIILAFASASWASTITFVQFHEATSQPSANEFAYINNGPDTANPAELITDPSGVPGGAVAAVFNYLSITSALPADLQGNQSATVTLTSSTTSPVVTGFGGTIGDEQIIGGGTLTDVLAITRTTPAAEGSGSRTNLLTMTFTGQLVGAIGGQTPQLSGGTDTGYTVTYTSDFLSFAGSTENDYSLTFTSWTDVNSALAGLQVADNNFFDSANAAGAATFDADINVPESATFALMFGAFVPLFLWRPKHAVKI